MCRDSRVSITDLRFDKDEAGKKLSEKRKSRFYDIETSSKIYMTFILEQFLRGRVENKKRMKFWQ